MFSDTNVLRGLVPVIPQKGPADPLPQWFYAVGFPGGDFPSPFCLWSNLAHGKGSYGWSRRFATTVRSRSAIHVRVTRGGCDALMTQEGLHEKAVKKF